MTYEFNVTFAIITHTLSVSKHAFWHWYILLIDTNSVEFWYSTIVFLSIYYCKVMIYNVGIVQVFIIQFLEREHPYLPYGVVILGWSSVIASKRCLSGVQEASKQRQATPKWHRTAIKRDLKTYTERKKKRRVNFIPKFHSSLKKFVKYFTMVTKRYMYGTKVPNFIGLWSTSLELFCSLVATPLILKSKSNWKSISGVPPSCCRCCPNSPLDRVNQSIDSSHRDDIPFIDQRIP